MHRRTFFAFTILTVLPAGCGQSGGSAAADGNQLTGLYEGGSGSRRNQLCLIEKDGRTSFGFVTWGEGDGNCSGAGTATREGNRLRLRLDNSESCVLEARVDGQRVTFPTDIAASCRNYYCGPGAQMTNAQFDRTGGSEADAQRARDVAGEPLCGG